MHLSESSLEMMHQVSGITQGAGLKLMPPMVAVGTQLRNPGRVFTRQVDVTKAILRDPFGHICTRENAVLIRLT